MSNLILPGTLAFELASQDLPPPPGWRAEADRTNGAMALIAPLGQGGLLEVVPLNRAWEYVFDGELDQRLDEIEATAPDIDLWLPGSL